MALIKKKTRKQLRKFINKHGDAVVTGLITTAIGALAARNPDTMGDLRHALAKQLGLADDRAPKRASQVTIGE